MHYLFKESSLWISIRYRIISTIAEYIAHCAVKSGNIRIRTDKSPDLRIIIPVLQIVHSGFFIVVVASVAERVDFSNGAGLAAGDAQDFSPAVIFVFYYSLSCVVNQCNDIILGAANFLSDSFPISLVHAILNLSLSACFSHGADLFFSGKDLFMKRIKNIDLLRAGAILYIMLYHCYVLSGQPWQSHTAIHTFLTLGGEVGVTLFFLLSGYGIYLSLSSSEARGCLPGWRAFMKKRCIRIMPQYYVCITVLLIFMSTQMFSNEGLRHILAYYTFTENFSPVTHGSINGALWTMGVIFQFYLIAPFLYKAVRKNWLVASIVSIVFTVICRFAVVRYLHNSGISDNSVYFVYERQVFSALDNFVLGMAAAAFWKQTGDRMQDYRLKPGLTVSIASAALILIWIFYYHSHGLYGTAPSGYPAHSILAVLLSILLVGFSLLPEMDFRFLHPLYFVARNQYGIYLWHMPIIMILQANAPWFNTMSQQRFWLFLPCMVVITCVFGYFATRFIDHPASAKKKG